jgi:hypothetical protein
MKHLFFVILLANIVFFLWEFNYGSWRQSTVDKPSLEINANKILLLSEVSAGQHDKAIAGEPEDEAVALLTDESTNYPQYKNYQGSDESVVFELQNVEGETGSESRNSQIETTTQQPASEIHNTKIEGKELTDGDQADILSDVDVNQKEQDDIGALIEKRDFVDGDYNAARQKSPLGQLKTKKQSATNAIMAEANTGSSQNYLEEREIESPDEIDSALECYEIGPFDNEESRQKWLDSLAISVDTFRFFSKENSMSNGFLVYYPAADTFAESKATYEKLQGQGVADIWLFRKGEARGNISLGVFTTESRALRLQKVYADRDMLLKIKPRFKTELQYYLRLSRDGIKLDEIQQAVALAIKIMPELSIKPANTCGL